MFKNLAAALLACGLLLSPAARAQDPGQDEVTLKDGGMIRGTVVSSEPGTSVKIIEVGQTQPRVIPWSQVSDVEKGKYAPRTAAQPGPTGPGYGVPPYGAAPPLPMPPPPPGPPPAPAAKMGDPGVVRLHIDSPVPATLIEKRAAMVGSVGGYGAYGGYQSYGIVMTEQRAVCTSPCDMVIDGSLGRTFVLSDDRFPSPGPFRFDGLKGDITMHLQPGSAGQRIGGVWAIVVGATAAVTGAILLPIAITTTTTDLNTGVDVATPNKGLRSAGIGLLGGGLVALGGGIALLATGATKMRIEQGGAAAPAAAPAAPPQAAARIAPRYWMGEF